MRKHDLYATLIERCEAAAANAAYFESSWYAYAVLEDRLRSLLRSSGGETKTVDGVEKTIRMMGPKLDVLRGRAKTSTNHESASTDATARIFAIDSASHFSARSLPGMMGAELMVTRDLPHDQ